MRKTRVAGVVLAATLILAAGLSGSAGARWHTANETAINIRKVCKDGAKITIADYSYPEGQLDTVPRDEEFTYHLVVTNPPFIPASGSDPVPQAPATQKVFEGDRTLLFNPVDFRLSPDQEVLHYAYSRKYSLTWSRRLTPGTRVGFDLFPDSADDVINTARVGDCLLG